MIRPSPSYKEPLQIIRYDEATFPPTFLVNLWQIIQEERLPSHFWNNGESLSLNEFIRFFSPQTGRILLVAVTVGEGAEIIGLAWLENILVGAHATGHLIFRRRYWGYGRTERAMRQGLREVFTAFDLQVITCQIHEENRLILRLLKRLGAHMLGTIPYWFKVGDRLAGTMIGYLLRDDILPREESIKLDNYEVSNGQFV